MGRKEKLMSSVVLSSPNNSLKKDKFASLFVIATLFMSIFIADSSKWVWYTWAIFLPFVLIEWFFLKRRPVFHLNRYFALGLFMLYGAILLASLLNGDWHSFRRGLRYLFCSIPLFMMIYLNQTFPVKKEIKIGLTAGMAILIIVGFWKWNFAWGTPMLSVYRQHNSLGTVWELLIPFGVVFTYKAETLVKRSIYGILTGLGIVCLFLSDSRGAMMGLGVGVVLAALTVIFLYRNHLTKKQIGLSLLAAVLIAGMAGGGILFVNHNRFEEHGYNGGGERILMLKASYHMWQDHKLTGVGLDNWKDNYYGPYRPEGQREEGLNMPHNMPIYFLSTTGIIGEAGYIIGSLLMLAGLGKGFKNSSHKALSAAGLTIFWALMVHGLVDGTLNDQKIARLYFVLLGYVLSWEYGVKRI